MIVTTRTIVRATAALASADQFDLTTGPQVIRVDEVRSHVNPSLFKVSGERIGTTDQQIGVGLIGITIVGGGLPTGERTHAYVGREDIPGYILRAIDTAEGRTV